MLCRFEWEVLLFFVAIVTLVDSQGRGYCAEAKYSVLELSVTLFLSTLNSL